MPAKKKTAAQTKEQQILIMYTYLEYLLVVGGLAAIWFAFDILSVSGYL